MFILCVLILEARKNLFWDFWSPFSFPYVFFLSVIIYKKMSEPTLGRNRPGLRLAGPLYSATKARGQPTAPRPAPNPNPRPPRAASALRRRLAAAGGSFSHRRFFFENRSVFRRFCSVF